MNENSLELPGSLTDAFVSGLPDAAYYVPGFISEGEEERLLSRIQNRPKREWTELSKRRLQNHPSKLSNDKVIDAPLPLWLSQPIVPRLLALPTYKVHASVLENENLSTSSAEAPGYAFSDSPHQAPNHVLINEYLPGQGIMPHEDGEAYHPIVSTVSLGSPIVLDLYEKDSEGVISPNPQYRILQEPRSLLITTGTLYKDFLHGIAFLDEDKDLGYGSIVNWDLLGRKDEFESGSCPRKTRTSLTFRDVRGVLKMSRFVPGLNFGRSK